MIQHQTPGLWPQVWCVDGQSWCFGTLMLSKQKACKADCFLSCFRPVSWVGKWCYRNASVSLSATRSLNSIFRCSCLRLGQLHPKCTAAFLKLKNRLKRYTILCPDPVNIDLTDIGFGTMPSKTKIVGKQIKWEKESLDPDLVYVSQEAITETLCTFPNPLAPGKETVHYLLLVSPIAPQSLTNSNRPHCIAAHGWLTGKQTPPSSPQSPLIQRTKECL